VSLRVRAPGIDTSLRSGADTIEGTVSEGWDRVAVYTSGPGARYFELVPADVPCTINHCGFFVEGRFRIARTINHARDAEASWRNAKVLVMAPPGIPPGRALTSRQKREFLERVLVAWERTPFQRFGQLIESAARGLEGAEHRDIFSIEDDELASIVEDFAIRTEQQG
jgi:hypothetical protein